MPRRSLPLALLCTLAIAAPAMADDNLADLQKRAQAGDVKAAMRLGNDFHGGENGVKADDRQALSWYRMAADHGSVEAYDAIGDAYRFGFGVTPDTQQAIAWYRKAVDAGDFSGLLSLRDLGINLPTSAPIDALERRADAGDAKAAELVGTKYFFGDSEFGVVANPEEGVRWYRTAVKLGDLEAAGMLGVAYRKGKGVPQDYRQAITWYQKAASAGDTAAMCDLGDMALDGLGVPADRGAWLKWYVMAGKAGDQHAASTAGKYYESIEDYAHALACYCEADRHADAFVKDHEYMLGLARLAHKGLGMPKDESTAYKWASLAAENYVPGATQLLVEIERSASPEEIYQAKAAVADYIKAHGPKGE